MARLRYGTMSWIYYMVKFARWYDIFPDIRSVRVKYVVRISSVTSLYIGHWKLFEKISLADRQRDRQTDRFAFPKTETQFYKLKTTAVSDVLSVHTATVRSPPMGKKMALCTLTSALLSAISLRFVLLLTSAPERNYCHRGTYYLLSR